MRESFLGWVKSLVNGNGSEGDQSAVASNGTARCALYTCSDCDRTYISEEMDTCPECGRNVATVPNERELGLT